MTDVALNHNFQFGGRYEFRDDESEYLSIRNDPIVIRDPGEDPVTGRLQFPKPYLRRGTGLQRYNMAPQYFKEGPPAIYKKEEFKSFLRNPQKKNPPPKIDNSAKNVRPCPRAKTLPKVIEKPRSFPERKYAMSAPKSFDDEVIPTLRDRAAEAFDVPFVPAAPVSLARQALKIPKTPVKKLVLNPATLPEESHDEEDDFQVLSGDSETEETQGPARRLNYPPSDTEDHGMEELVEINQAHQEVPITNKCDNVNRGTRYTSQAPKVINSDSDSNCGRRSSRQIAEAMKRKGLTDNVRKQLGWNVTPKKRRALSIVKKVAIRKPKAKVQREEFTIHQLKDKLRQLEEEKRNLQVEIQKNIRLEKENLDEKVNLNKRRKEMEAVFEQERKIIEDEKLKLVEDQKKFRREKIIFEKHLQEFKDAETKRPSRDEREEIRQLKEDLAKLKEAQKMKDSRTAAAQAQFRTRIVFLERENSKLKEDLELAERMRDTRKVRFESAGSVQSKVLNAINDQLDSKFNRNRPSTARDKGSTVVRPLRRSKSAADLKPAVKRAHTRARSERTEKEVNILTLDQPETINLISDDVDTDLERRDDVDSGLGSKPSSAETSCSRNLDTQEFTPYSTISEIKRRVGNVLGSQPNDIIVNTCHIDERPPFGEPRVLDGWSDRNHLTKSHETSCHGCMPDHWNRPETNTENWQRSPKKVSRDFDKWQASLNITTENTGYTPKGLNNRVTAVNGNGVCPRHQAPKVADARQIWPSSVPDPYVIRTELAGGDVEEEERHTGVRRVFCSVCGAYETSYRSRPGYRRTTYSQGNILEELPDGVKVMQFKNGTEKKMFPNGDILFIFTNGDRELTTRGFKKLETANGIVKYLYDDGRTETHYPSGRVRVKDKNGHLVMDTGGLAS